MKRILAILVVLTIVFSLCSCEKKSESITLPAKLRQFDNSIYEKHTVFISNVERTESVDVLSNMLLVEKWQEIDAPKDENLVLTIHLSELYEIYIYESYALAYYGYASITEEENAYYGIPEDATSNIQSYVNNLSS